MPKPTLNEKLAELADSVSPLARQYLALLMVSAGALEMDDDAVVAVLGLWTDAGVETPDLGKVRALKKEIQNAVRGWNLAEALTAAGKATD